MPGRGRLGFGAVQIAIALAVEERDPLRHGVDRVIEALLSPGGAGFRFFLRGDV